MSFNRLASFCCTKVHGFIATYPGGGIAWCVRQFARLPLPVRMSIGFALLALGIVGAGHYLSDLYLARASFSPENLRVLEGGAVLGQIRSYATFAYSAAGACGVSAVLCFVRFRYVYVLLEAVYAAWLLSLLQAFNLIFKAPGLLYSVDYKLFDRLSRNALWTDGLARLAPLVLLGVLMLLAISVSTVRRYYGIGKGSALGDKVLGSFRKRGAEARYQTSWYWSVAIFLLIIVGPFLYRILFEQCGREDPYGLVQGAGTPELQVVKVKKVKKEKKEKKFVLNQWSPYILERAKLDDNDNMMEMEESTQDLYVADQPVQQGGKLGKGGGKKGGWPKGMADAKVRFIRLEYDGGDWDQDMGKGADYNLLVKFHQITGFPIWKETESRPVSRLSKFPKHNAPPFVFLTGSRGINMSASDIAALRRYLVDEGGLLFIDNGGGTFGSSVRNLVSRIFPDKPFIDVPNDDPLYQAPYVFPDGAPPFWHHDGNRAKGVRIGDRLVIYYHPGDINDAWKDGHSGASDAVAEQAFRLGINVMYYAFNAYYARHFEGKK